MPARRSPASDTGAEDRGEDVTEARLEGVGVRRTRDAARTTAALVDAARAEFTAAGFAAARTEAIVAAAGLTRGALYHHFADKAALFRAVVEEIQGEIADEVRRAARRAGDSPVAAMRAGFARYLDCCTRDDVRRVVLVDGPSVLGWSSWREIEERQAFAATVVAVRGAVAAGELPDVPVEPLARVLLGMVTQAGLDVGVAARPRRRRRELGAAIDAVLDGLTSR